MNYSTAALIAQLDASLSTPTPSLDEVRYIAEQLKRTHALDPDYYSPPDSTDTESWQLL